MHVAIDGNCVVTLHLEFKFMCMVCVAVNSYNYYITAIKGRHAHSSNVHAIHAAILQQAIGTKAH